MFVFFDIVAAEFALNAFYAQEVDACNAYLRGEDIYMHYAYLFPEGTPRNVIKTLLLANIYGQSAASCAVMLGISRDSAQAMIERLANDVMRMSELKRWILAYDHSHRGYYAPNGLNQRDLIKVADFGKDGFNTSKALSVYTQSGLGFFMQQFTERLRPLVSGTLLSVYDSVLVEMRPESVERYKEFVIKQFSPLRPEEFIVGKTFWEAAGYK